MARKLYELKPLDSGQTVSLGEHTYTIWSAGPAPSTVWAYDEEGTWTVLKTRKGEVASVDVTYPGVSPNALLHAALAVVRGRPYWWIQRARPRDKWSLQDWRNYYNGFPVIGKILHLDPACPHTEEEHEALDAKQQSYISRLLVNGDRAVTTCECVFQGRIRNGY